MNGEYIRNIGETLSAWNEYAIIVIKNDVIGLNTAIHGGVRRQALLKAGRVGCKLLLP